MVPKVRERLSVSKREVLKNDVKRFSFKKLNEVEVNKNYQVSFSNNIQEQKENQKTKLWIVTVSNNEDVGHSYRDMEELKSITSVTEDENGSLLGDSHSTVIARPTTIQC